MLATATKAASRAKLGGRRTMAHSLVGARRDPGTGEAV